MWSQLAGLQGCLLGKAWHVVWSHCWVLVMLALTGFSDDLTALSDVSAAGQPTKSLMDTYTPCMILLTVGVPALLMPCECMFRCVCGRCDTHALVSLRSAAMRSHVVCSCVHSQPARAWHAARLRECGERACCCMQRSLAHAVQLPCATAHAAAVAPVGQQGFSSPLWAERKPACSAVSAADSVCMCSSQVFP